MPPNQGMETDALQLTLRFSFRARLMPSVGQFKVMQCQNYKITCV